MQDYIAIKSQPLTLGYFVIVLVLYCGCNQLILILLFCWEGQFFFFKFFLMAPQLIFFDGTPFFLHISSSWVKIRLYTENQLPRLSGSFFFWMTPPFFVAYFI